jgi:hypothetical protein
MEFLIFETSSTIPIRPTVKSQWLRHTATEDFSTTGPFYNASLFSYLSCAFNKQNNVYVGSEVLTAVVMNSTVFWDITPCSPLKVNQRFGGTYHLHLQFLARVIQN